MYLWIIFEGKKYLNKIKFQVKLCSTEQHWPLELLHESSQVYFMKQETDLLDFLHLTWGAAVSWSFSCWSTLFQFM